MKVKKKWPSIRAITSSGIGQWFYITSAQFQRACKKQMGKIAQRPVEKILKQLLGLQNVAKNLHISFWDSSVIKQNYTKCVLNSEMESYSNSIWSSRETESSATSRNLSNNDNNELKFIKNSIIFTSLRYQKYRVKFSTFQLINWKTLFTS